MRKFVVLFLMLMLAGCDGSSDLPQEVLEPPKFDLTGDWMIIARFCQSASDDLPQYLVADIFGDYEVESPGDVDTRIVQTGNNLEILDLETGDRISGSISGVDIQYSFSGSQAVGTKERGVDLYVEDTSTVLDENRMAGIEDIQWTLTLQEPILPGGGTMLTGRTLCSTHRGRVVEVESIESQ